MHTHTYIYIFIHGHYFFYWRATGRLPAGYWLQQDLVPQEAETGARQIACCLPGQHGVTWTYVDISCVTTFSIAEFMYIHLPLALTKQNIWVALPFCIVWFFYWVALPCFALFLPCPAFFCRDLFPCHCNFFNCCMYKCRYFGILRVELQKGVTRSLESWDMTYCDLCLPIFKNNYQQMATFRIFRRVQFEHTSNAMFCNFPLNFAVWPQPSRFLKAEIQICAFFGGVFAPCLQGFAPCLRACFGPECINLLLKTCRWDWRKKNSSKIALKLQKFCATAAEQRVALPQKNWVEGWQNHGSVFGSPRPDGALKPLIWWTFPWEIWFTNIVDMIVPLSTTSALSALFGSFWVVLPKRGSQSKKMGMWKVQAFIYLFIMGLFVHLFI